MTESSQSILPVAGSEMDRLVAECRKLPLPAGGYADDNFGPYDDFVTNVMLTVLDLQMHNVAVDNSIKHYRNERWDEIRRLTDLEELLDRHPDSSEGNRKVAQYIWGNNHWKRVEWLRGFVAFLGANELTSQELLREWAVSCDYDRDFKGKVKFLGVAACQWLRMRLGVDTVKPDVHTHRFVRHAIGRDLDDWGVVRVIEEAAKQLGVSARRLDGSIWEHERGGAGTI